MKNRNQKIKAMLDEQNLTPEERKEAEKLSEQVLRQLDKEGVKVDEDDAEDEEKEASDKSCNMEVYEREFEPITKKDIVKIGFKYFIPPILSADLTIACIVGAQHINTVRQAAMAASYELLRTHFYDSYRSHVRDAVDKKKYEEIEANPKSTQI